MKTFLLSVLLLTAALVRGGEVLRVSGSTTVKGALEPKQDQLEAAMGAKIEFSGLGSSPGLISLASGTTDVAMLSSPIEEVAKAVGTSSAGQIDIAGMKVYRIGATKLVFIVNPKNPLRHLSLDQLHDVLTGKVTNWSEVGGLEGKIVFVGLAHAAMPSIGAALRGDKVTAYSHVVTNATAVPTFVASEPNALGLVSTSRSRGQTSVLATDAEFEEPLFLVTKGEPGPLAAKLIEAAKKLMAAP